MFLSTLATQGPSNSAKDRQCRTARRLSWRSPLVDHEAVIGALEHLAACDRDRSQRHRGVCRASAGLKGGLEEGQSTDPSSNGGSSPVRVRWFRSSDVSCRQPRDVSCRRPRKFILTMMRRPAEAACERTPRGGGALTTLHYSRKTHTLL